MSGENQPLLSTSSVSVLQVVFLEHFKVMQGMVQRVISCNNTESMSSHNTLDISLRECLLGIDTGVARHDAAVIATNRQLRLLQ